MSWKGKKVLITGANGFIGSNLVKHFVELGADVVGIDKDFSKKSLLFYEAYIERIKYFEFDIVDFEKLNQIIQSESVRIIYHLAAEVEVVRSQMFSFETMESNVRGTYNICEIVKRNKNQILSCVMASTDKAYGHYSADKMPYCEHYSLKSKYIYETSKATADMICQAYTNSYPELPIAITRFCNIYGPGQVNETALIPSLIFCFMGKEEFLPRSDGSPIRDFVFVNDVVRLYEIIGESLIVEDKAKGQIFNLGTNSPVTVKDLTLKLSVLLERENIGSIILDKMKNMETHAEIDVQYMSYEKVEKFFSFKPHTSLDDGLIRTIEWLRMYCVKP